MFCDLSVWYILFCYLVHTYVHTWRGTSELSYPLLPKETYYRANPQASFSMGMHPCVSALGEEALGTKSSKLPGPP